jgi:hypothetical protein
MRECLCREGAGGNGTESVPDTEQTRMEMPARLKAEVDWRQRRPGPGRRSCRGACAFCRLAVAEPAMKDAMTRGSTGGTRVLQHGETR